MRLVDNVLLLHVKDYSKWVGYGVTAASFLSTKIGNIAFLPDLMVNQNLSPIELDNPQLLKGSKAEYAKKLGFDIVWNDLIKKYWLEYPGLEKPFDFQRHCFGRTTGVGAKAFAELVSVTAATTSVSRDHRGYGGINRQAREILESGIYPAINLKPVAFDFRDARAQLIDLFLMLCYCQYVNWANSRPHTVDNLLGCYFLVNGYTTNYKVNVNRWRNVDGTFEKPLVIKEISMDRPSEHFSWKEVFYAGSMSQHVAIQPPANVRANMLKTVSVVEAVRQWHGSPITINSGWRAPAVNAAVKGVKTSAHLIGGALDCSFSGVERNAKAQWELALKVGKFLKESKIPFDQIIAYNTFIHIGVVNNAGTKRNEVFKIKQYRSTVRKFG